MCRKSYKNMRVEVETVSEAIIMCPILERHVASIGRGLYIRVDIHKGDTPEQRQSLVTQTVNLKAFDG